MFARCFSAKVTYLSTLMTGLTRLFLRERRPFSPSSSDELESVDLDCLCALVGGCARLMGLIVWCCKLGWAELSAA